MAGYASIIPMAVSAVSSVAGAASRSSAASDAAEAQADSVARQNALVLQQQATEERRQRDLLAKASATQRANTAALGMDGSGGSSDAILAGMSADTAQAIADSAQSAQNRLKTYQSSSSSNLLESGLGQGLSVFRSFYGSGD